MPRRGTLDLPLHGGAAPRWLVERMKKLARAVCDVMISDHGQKELLARLSNPDWFQALSCVLAFDWHSSGTTTVLCGVLKSVMDPGEHGLAVVGGKGSRARNTPAEIASLGEEFSMHPSRVESLRRASRLSAKVDSALLQDGFGMYHHAMFIAESCDWAVVQQGMNPESRTARRYHWASEGLENFVEEPHSGIVSEETTDVVLDMTSRESRACRLKSLETAREGDGMLRDVFATLSGSPQRTLLHWSGLQLRQVSPALPPKVNWGVLDRIYDFRPSNYEDLVLVRGVGANTVRALALVSELVYGEPPSWEDPVKYSYCLGGKDGVPYPVDRGAYDESVQILRDAIADAKVGQTEKMKALRRLKGLVPPELRSSKPPWGLGRSERAPMARYCPSAGVEAH